jgi:putative membrane protein
MRILFHLLWSSVAVYVAARLLPGVRVDSFATAVEVAVVLGLVNAVLRPILMILTLPINILTLGLFTFVVIGLCVELVAQIVPGFALAGFGWALAFAGVLAVINWFFHAFEKK